ncbi:MAG: RlmE family RNA methyltransferase [SAR324 cluster bacterium]|nr:RlmE family RNA methyltransferase [SAR324 cluster bacterium]
MKQIKDHYFHKAKKDGYAARSAYKLEEMDRRQHLLKKKDRVLDLGCSPGSWLQYTARQVGSEGEVLGIDLSPVKINLPPQVTVLQTDIFEIHFEDRFFHYFDVILSDMAPKTTGIRTVDAQRAHHLCEHVAHLAVQLLKPGGTLLMKAFQGAPFEGLRKEIQEQFQQVKICKPKSSRQESVEIFLLGKQKYGRETKREL